MQEFLYQALECSGGDKNHISVSTHIASVYIKISLVLFVAASSWKLIHSAPNPLGAANLFGVTYFQAINPLCDRDRHGQHSSCFLHFPVSKCPLLEFPRLPSGFLQVFTNFSLEQQLQQPPIFSVVILYLILDHWWKDWILGGSDALKFHFSVTTFLANRFVKSAIWLVIDALNVCMKMVQY